MVSIPWALNQLRLRYRQVAHGSGNRVEALFASLKAATRRFNYNVNSRTVEDGLACWRRFLRGFQYWRESIT
ncbi:MAG: hypothetical protein ACP5K1_03445 [Candidatus Bathyarchaeia archaeon]